MSNIEQRLAEAQTFLTSGDLAAAEAAYKAILNDAPENPEALRNMGFVLMNRGHLDAAHEKLYLAAKADPRSAETFDHIAELHAARNEPRLAVQACELAIERAPDRPEPRHRLALMYYRFRALKAARDAAQKTLEVSSSLAGARQLYGAILAELGEFEPALEELFAERKAKRPLPDPNAWLAKTLMALDRGQEIMELPPAGRAKQRHAETVLDVINAWQTGDLNRAEERLSAARDLSRAMEERERPWVQQKVLEGLLANRKLHPELYEPVVEQTIPVIGDILATSAAGLLITPGGQPRRLRAYSMSFGRFRRFGAPAFPAADRELEVILAAAPPSDEVIFAFTELNLRQDRHVLPRIRRQGDARALEQLTLYVERAMGSLHSKAQASGRTPAFCNLPHQVMVEGLAQSERDFLDEAARHINAEIAKFAAAESCRVIDLYGATSKADGAVDRSLYFFENFPRPSVLAKAFAKAYT